MNEIRAEIADFEKSVNTYISEVVPDLTTRLIDCINRSIVDAETKIGSERDAIDSTIIDGLFKTGDSVIGEIRELLTKLEGTDDD
jgi:phage terminase Nu1 subunit (DNA packaging protein)